VIAGDHEAAPPSVPGSTLKVALGPISHAARIIVGRFVVTGDSLAASPGGDGQNDSGKVNAYFNE
jgi:hypothetical protein